jgi:hypothetical protein
VPLRKGTFVIKDETTEQAEAAAKTGKQEKPQKRENPGLITQGSLDGCVFSSGRFCHIRCLWTLLTLDYLELHLVTLGQ